MQVVELLLLLSRRCFLLLRCVSLLVVLTAADERLRINANGRVGIGETNPQAQASR